MAEGVPPRAGGTSMGKRKVEPGDRGELVGLRSSDLNGRRVVVEAQVAGKDGNPRFGEQAAAPIGRKTD